MGGEAIWQGLSTLIKRRSLPVKFRQGVLALDHGNINQAYLGVFTLAVLIPYFLLNTGFVFEVTKSELYDVVDTPSSVALSSYRVDMKASNHREQAGNKWISGAIDNESLVFADIYAARPLSGLLSGRVGAFPRDDRQMPANTYIYLKTWNINKNEAVFGKIRGERIWFEHVSFDSLPRLSWLISNKNLVYDNGGARILAPSP
jgi:uncharacterized membrane protein